MALAGIGAAIAGRDREQAVAVFRRAEEIAMRLPMDGKPKAARVSALCAIAVAVAPTDPDWSQRLTDEAEQTARRMKGEKKKYRYEDSDEYTSALFSVGAAAAAVSIERGKKLIKKGEAKRDFMLYDREAEEQIRVTVRALTVSDPDRAESIAHRLLSGEEKADALKEMTFDLAATDPDRAERIAGTIEDLVEQAATLIEIAVVQGGRTPSPIPWVDTKLPKIPYRMRIKKF